VYCSRLRTVCGKESGAKNEPNLPEFRREAIQLVRASDEDHPKPKVAREIGVLSVANSGQVLVMDNLSSHKRERVKELIKQRG
jgi:hypothetical protein